MREALDAGQTHVKLRLIVRINPDSSIQGPKSPSPLLLKPCCNSVHLVLKRAPATTAGPASQPCATAQSEPHADDILAWPFVDLPLPRRQQITLRLDTLRYFYRYPSARNPNLQRILAKLGPLLPAVTHLDITDCNMRMWRDWDEPNYSTFFAMMASAFPALTSLAMRGPDIDMKHLALHLGNRLRVLELALWQRLDLWEPHRDLVFYLPRLCGLRRLVTVGAQWHRREEEEEEEEEVTEEEEADNADAE